MKRVSFLFLTQEFWLFSWIPGFFRAKTQANLTFSYPLKIMRNLFLGCEEVFSLNY